MGLELMSDRAMLASAAGILREGRSDHGDELRKLLGVGAREKGPEEGGGRARAEMGEGRAIVARLVTGVGRLRFSFFSCT